MGGGDAHWTGHIQAHQVDGGHPSSSIEGAPQAPPLNPTASQVSTGSGVSGSDGVGSYMQALMKAGGTTPPKDVSTSTTRKSSRRETRRCIACGTVAAASWHMTDQGLKCAMCVVDEERPPRTNTGTKSSDANDDMDTTRRNLRLQPQVLPRLGRRQSRTTRVGEARVRLL